MNREFNAEKNDESLNNALLSIDNNSRYFAVHLYGIIRRFHGLPCDAVWKYRKH